MNIAPLLAAAEPIPAHAFMAIGVAVLGSIQFLMPKGTALHKIFGRIWAAGMAFVAASGLFIYTIRVIGPFSPIHALSVFTLVMLAIGVRRARRGDIAGHRRAMIALYVLGLILAGVFTLLPGRVMHAVVFG